MKYSQLESYLNSRFPLKLAESWDNVGFIFGKRNKNISKVLTCLTVTPNVVKEAVNKKIDLLISHHPFPFRKTNRITDDTFEGEMILDLAEAGVSVYSPHTAFDSAVNGINELTIKALGVEKYLDLIPHKNEELSGAGRYGNLTQPQTLDSITKKVKEFYNVSSLKVVGSLESQITKIAIACGSGSDFFGPARAKGCQLFITGEANFHTCVQAQAYGVSLILTGHYASERFAVEVLAGELKSKFNDLEIEASSADTSPVFSI